MADLCIALNIAGEGGIGGGGGFLGQTSQLAGGHGSRSYGIPIVKTTTGVTSLFTVQLTKDLLGKYPMDFSENIDKIDFVCRTSGSPGDLFKVPCLILLNGKVSFKLTPKEVNYREGIHYALFHCWNSDALLAHVFKCCLLIQKSLIGSKVSNKLPLTIALVRMALYDTSGEQNLLLDDLEFSDIVIASCMKRAIDDWNEMPPSLATDQTVATFPYRANLCNGSVGYVLRMAANRYIRNQMRHSNAGLSMDDNDKGQLYLQLAHSMIALWKNWIQVKKNLLNQLLCMGVISDAFYQDTTDWLY